MTLRDQITDLASLAADVPCQHQSAMSDEGRSDTDEFSVEEGDFHDESSDALDLWVFEVSPGHVDPQPGFSGGVTEVPSDGREDVTFHLDEGRLVVRLAAHVAELADERDLVLAVFKLGGDPQSSASDQLVMLLVDDSLGDVSVDDVHGEVEDFGS